LTDIKAPRARHLLRCSARTGVLPSRAGRERSDVADEQVARDRIAVDDEGFLIDPDDWDEPVAIELARREDVVLTEDHWKVLRFMRDFLDEHRLIPDARFVIRFVARELGAEARARDRLFELFPYGYVKQA
jgi:tRNA 2-thiouridine synthesizing protein E